MYHGMPQEIDENNCCFTRYFSAGVSYLRKKPKSMGKLLKWMAVFPLVAGLAACDDFGNYPPEGSMGELQWVIDRNSIAKASGEIPDTNDFILTVTDSKGVVLYDGAYGDSPVKLSVPAGSYTIKIVSEVFTSPAFDRPVYGDEQVVLVNAGESATVVLNCTLVNCGIRLKIASDFLTSYPNGVLFVKQDPARLMYGYREKRIAYFMPGEISVVLNNDNKDETLFVRNLEARQILTVSISAPGAPGDGVSTISAVVDTSKTWLTDSWVIGGDNSGGGSGSIPDAYSVADAKKMTGQKDVWVYGYIVGGDLTTSATGEVKTVGIIKPTHLAMADRSSVTDKTSCLAVELPAGKIRDALNLVDHPDLIGARVYVKGEIVEKYFGTSGMKGTSDYAMK